jgi:alpha-beta hydrolase superfamily lysophospholipase
MTRYLDMKEKDLYKCGNCFFLPIHELLSPETHMDAIQAFTPPRIFTLKMSDGYETHYRVWGPDSGEDVVILLHAGMSHSSWQAPLADALTSISEMSFVAPDRRGCGLNIAARGDVESAEQLIDDAVRHAEFQKRSFSRVHLAGWCMAAQDACLAAARTKSQNLVSSLILITPAFFWSERLKSIIQFLSTAVFSILSEFNIEPDLRRPFAPLPLQISDFTSLPQWQEFIEEDPLRTTKVSINYGIVSQAMQDLSLKAALNVEVPTFFAVAKQDRIVDNAKVLEFVKAILERSPLNKIAFFDTEHAIHFAKADELAKEIYSFILALSDSALPVDSKSQKDRTSQSSPAFEGRNANRERSV